jgi:hypothetical protein
LTSKRSRRRAEFRDLAVQCVKARGEVELNDIVKFIQERSRFGVERCSLGVILGGEKRLVRSRMTIGGTYVTTYSLEGTPLNSL